MSGSGSMGQGGGHGPGDRRASGDLERRLPEDIPAGWAPLDRAVGGRLPFRQDLWLIRFHGVLIMHAFGSLRRASKLLISVIGSFLLGYLLFATWLFHKAIRFADHFLGIGAVLVDRMFFMLFAFLGGMLILSSMLLFSTGVFRSRETSWLQTLPLDSARLFRWKCMETGVVASWASLFLIAPLLYTYGRVNMVDWGFFPLSLLVLLPFLGLMSNLGCFLALVLARPLQARWFRWALVIGFLLGTGLLIARTRPQDADQWTSGSLLPLVDYLLRQTQVFHSAWLPSTWASRAVLGMAEGLSSKTLFYGGLLVVYWLALSNLMWWGATAWFQRIWLDVQGRRVAARGKRGRVSFFSLGRWTGAVLTLLPVRRGIRALLWKDVVTFWRDPSQWTQASLFFGMLGFYIFNLRHIRTQLDQLFWACLVGYLNLVSVGMILAAIQTRFVFPQFTLEGRRIWILGLAPVPLERLIWGKFWLSGTAGGLMAFFLMLTSSRFLGAGTWLVVSTTLTGVVMSYSLTGLAIGLGVLHPTIGRTSHFRGEEENPARLVSGFGGTFCLVASMFYVFAVGAVEGFGMFRVMRKGGIAEDPLMFAFMVLWVVASSYWIGWFPMHMARKKLARFES